MRAWLNSAVWPNARQLGYYLLTGLIVVIPALMNNSPLVYSDSGTYMRLAFDLEPALDRPIGYSLILRALTWRATMWTPIFFQGAVTSWLIFEVLRQLFPGRMRLWRVHLVLLVALLLLSSLPWYAAQLMPDVIAGLLGLVVFLLFFGRALGRVKLVFLWVLLFFFIISHYSFMAMMMGLATTLLLARATPWGRHSMGRSFWKTWTGFAAIIAAGFLFLLGLNDRYGRGFVMSPTSDLFLAAKMCESGVMYEHLKRTCADHHRPLCDRMDELNTTAMHFVWDFDAPIRDRLDLDVASAKVAPLVHEVLTDPRNWGMLIWTSINATLIQLAQVTIGSGIEPYRENTSPGLVYQWQLRHELPMYMNSLEQRGAWKLDTVNILAGPILVLSLLITVLLWPMRMPRWKAFSLIVVATVILNAAATGALANVYDRLQARVTWMLVFLALLLLLRLRKQKWLLGLTN